MTGQRPTSALATKQASSTPPSTAMSIQEEWLDANTMGRPSHGTAPSTWTRMPSKRLTPAQ